ncbi:MAG: toll/interleukin-1 receptor domain-containing protein [Oscillospiraceae bacterium]|nr:toll/interleukin-1 receptor domain-containing protein [Oscillospiraceae bacterium]
MKIFVSWSGELSQKVAQGLKKWLPCIIQSLDVFYSPEDIEKGENWDSKISTQLAECNYGIICLTSENTNAPWINFEAGAIAKALEARVAALMINIKPSDIQGPLKRYQATKFEKDDVYHLISDINDTAENPLSSDVLNSTFSAIWDKMYEEIKSSIDVYTPKDFREAFEKKVESVEVIEEILQLVRKQNTLLNSPEQLLPPSYFEYLQNEFGGHRLDDRFSKELHILANRTEVMLDRLLSMKQTGDDSIKIMQAGYVFDILEVLIFGILDYPKNSISRKKVSMLKRMYDDCVKEVNMV